MLYIVLIQLITTLVLAFIGGLLGGLPGFLSGFSGGACCVVPNGIFALYLCISSRKLNQPSFTSFFAAEFLKIIATISLIGLTAYLYRDLNWLGFIASFILVIKIYIILLFRH